MSYGKMSALATVVREGPLRPGELARAESVTKPTISRVLDVLEQKGLIERTADPDDGRAFVVMATRSGEQAVAEARSERAGMVAELVDRLSDDEFEDVMRALTALERVSDPGH
nr:MarR family transcriptional regulator [Curtobacterium pusillum]